MLERTFSDQIDKQTVPTTQSQQTENSGLKVCGQSKNRPRTILLVLPPSMGGGEVTWAGNVKAVGDFMCPM